MSNRKKGMESELPEDIDYKDTGCSHHPACLSCPFVRCKHDDSRDFRYHRTLESHRVVMEAMEAQGLSVRDTAMRFGASRRTIFRIKEEWKDAGH